MAPGPEATVRVIIAVRLVMMLPNLSDRKFGFCERSRGDRGGGGFTLTPWRTAQQSSREVKGVSSRAAIVFYGVDRLDNEMIRPASLRQRSELAGGPRARGRDGRINRSRAYKS